MAARSLCFEPIIARTFVTSPFAQSRVLKNPSDQKSLSEKNGFFPEKNGKKKENNQIFPKNLGKKRKKPEFPRHLEPYLGGMGPTQLLSIHKNSEERKTKMEDKL